MYCLPGTLLFVTSATFISVTSLCFISGGASRSILCCDTCSLSHTSVSLSLKVASEFLVNGLSSPWWWIQQNPSDILHSQICFGYQTWNTISADRKCVAFGYLQNWSSLLFLFYFFPLLHHTPLSSPSLWCMELFIYLSFSWRRQVITVNVFLCRVILLHKFIALDECICFFASLVRNTF